MQRQVIASDEERVLPFPACSIPSTRFVVYGLAHGRAELVREVEHRNTLAERDRLRGRIVVLPRVVLLVPIRGEKQFPSFSPSYHSVLNIEYVFDCFLTTLLSFFAGFFMETGIVFSSAASFCMERGSHVSA